MLSHHIFCCFSPRVCDSRLAYSLTTGKRTRSGVQAEERFIKSLKVQFSKSTIHHKNVTTIFASLPHYHLCIYQTIIQNRSRVIHLYLASAHLPIDAHKHHIYMIHSLVLNDWTLAASVCVCVWCVFPIAIGLSATTV